MTRILCSTLLALATSPVSFASSSLVFPRLTQEAETVTGLALLNPNGTGAEVVLTAYNHAGQVLTGPGITNPRTVNIPAGRQFADVTASLFGNLDPASTAWISATSDASDITGFFLYLDFSFTFFDGADLPRRSTRLVFNEVRLKDGFTTEVNIVNPGTFFASVTLTLESGAARTFREISISPNGVLRFDVADFFGALAPGGVDSLPAEAIIRVSSNTEVAGFAFVRGEGDLLGLNAVPEDELLNRLYFPQLAMGDAITSELSLSNLSGEEVLVTLTAHRENGDLFGTSDVSNNPVTLPLAAGEVRRFDLGESFGMVDGTTRVGWLEVSSTSRAVNGALSYTVPSVGSFAAVASSASGLTSAAFSHLATDLGFFTGIALLNPGSLAVDVRIVALGVNGQILGTATRTLAPGQRIAQLLGVELIPQALGQAGGSVYVRSSTPVYLTSLFGRVAGSGVLANIPAQRVPSTYRPDAAQPQVRVNPPLASLEPGASVQFSAQLTGNPNPPLWKVNGITGGNAALGMISAAGLYQAPAASPMKLPVSVSAEIGEQSASASVDVLMRQVLAGGRGQVQSVAYLQGLERLYTAELTGAGLARAGVEQALSSTIFDVTGSVIPLRSFPGEDVSKILPYRGSDGHEYLLAAGRATGQVYRVRGDDGNNFRVVASGLNAPESLVLDPGTGDLLVGEADGISRINATQLGADLTGLAGEGPGPGTTLLEGVQARGLAVDTCTGDILFSDGAAKSVRRFERMTGEVTTVVTLTDPTQLLGLSRAGVSCPEGFHLLVAEPGADRVTRVVPALGTSDTYADSPGIRDLAFLPPGPLSGSEAILLAELPAGTGRVVNIMVPQLYEEEPVNLPEPSACVGAAVIADPNLETVIRSALGVGAGETITCEVAAGLEQISAISRQIQSLSGLEAFTGLKILNLFNNGVTDLSPLARLSNLEQLRLGANHVTDTSPLTGLRRLSFIDLTANLLTDVQPLHEITSLQKLWLYENQIEDISPLSSLTGLTELFIDRNMIDDISPVAAMSELRNLTFYMNQVSSIAAVSNLPKLQSMDAGFNQVSDLSPLESLTNLLVLYLDGNQISNIAPLSGLTNLRQLFLAGNQISQVSPLAGLNLVTFIDLFENLVSDISPLAGLTQLKQLDLGNNQISNIQPLAGLNDLDFLRLGGNQVTDITALSGKTLLLVLLLNANQITDLGPLQGLESLRSLSLQDNQIMSLAPLVANPGIGDGDTVDVKGNLLDSADCSDIDALVMRGVFVDVETTLCN